LDEVLPGLPDSTVAIGELTKVDAIVGIWHERATDPVDLVVTVVLGVLVDIVLVHGLSPD